MTVATIRRRFDGSPLDLCERIFIPGSFNLLLYSPRPERRGSWISRGSRYSLILTEPDRVIQSSRCDARLFREIERTTRNSLNRTGLPFTGGWAGFLSYEMLSLFEKIKTSGPELPYYLFGLFSSGVCVDNDERTMTVFAPTAGQARRLHARLNRPPISYSDLKLGKWKPLYAKKQFLDMVARAKEYIREGDIYQVNLSQPFRIYKKNDASVWPLFRSLMEVNPSPFSFYLGYGSDLEVISCSPERLFQKTGSDLETRPIAGTYPKIGRRSFRNDPKEQAEHIMLVDLERNDLGRIAVTGSVRVRDLLAIEEYSHLIHLVSRVTARLGKNVTVREIFRALFPGGTITGCPKVRAMQIISELEPTPRGLYTGSAGYISFDRTMDFNIIIRTLVFRGREGCLRAGAGIVADSQPRREYRETLRKAEALFALI